MAKIYKNETHVIKAIESLAKLVSDSDSYNDFLNYTKKIFDQHEMTNSVKNRVTDSVYTILKNNGLEISPELFDADMESLRTVDHITLSAEELEDIKKSAKLKKGLVIAGCVIGAGLVGFGGARLASIINPTSIEKSTDEKNNDVDANLDGKQEVKEDKNKEIKDDNKKVENPLLKFNPEDKKALVSNVYNMFKDTLPKGHKVTKDNVKQEVANWTDAYIVANIENIGPDFLLKYFQSDSKDALSLIENYLRVVSQVVSDARVSKDTWNLDYMFANEADQKLVSKYQTLVANIVKETIAKNKDGVKEYSVKLRKELEKLVESNGSRQYSNAAVVMSVNISFAGAEVAKVNGMAKVVMPDDLSNVLYTDGAEKCIAAAKKGNGTLSQNIKIANKKIKAVGGQDNVYMKAILGLCEEVEKDLDKVVEQYASLSDEERNQKFANEMSYNASLVEIIEKVSKILDAYKADKDYVTLYYGKDFFKNHTQAQIKEITTVTRSSSDKRVVETVEDIDDKDFIEGTVETKDHTRKVHTDSKAEQILVEGATRDGYTAGYNKGNKQGGLGQSKNIGSISVPGKYAANSKAKAMYISQFKSGFETGYKAGKAVYDANKDYSKEGSSKDQYSESPVYDVHEQKPEPSKEPVKEPAKEPVKEPTNEPSKEETPQKGEEIIYDDDDVYDIEDVVETKSVDSISKLKALRDQIANLEIEDEYEEENTHTL